MLVLLDLDNTLVDRDGAFKTWAASFVAEVGADLAEMDWLVSADGSGYTPRRDLAERIVRRFGLSCSVDAVVARLRFEVVAGIECFPGVLDGLDRLRSSGAVLGVVTNGESRQQRLKMTRTGLDELILDSVISAEAGVKKPDAGIFTLARGMAPQEAPVWMVGDHPEADIAGARAVGFLTGWVSRGKPWTASWEPTLTAPSTAEVLAGLLGG